MDLNGKVALITGAARRVGRVIALEMARRGADIALSWHFDDEPWQQTCDEIAALGRRGYVQRCDVTSADQVRSLVDGTVVSLGRLDVLVNNASVWLSKPFLEISAEEWDLSMDVNARGPFLASQAAARHMLAGGGVILNITDLSAFQAWPHYAHHAAAKAALVSLTKSMAVELAPRIRVNAIAPGTVLLPDGAPAAKREWAEGKSLLKRVGTPEDVARTALFLIESDFATGSVVFIDGGRALV